MDIFEKLDEIGEYIEQAKVVPILNQKLLDVDYLMKMLEELYAAIPAEIKDAKNILEKQKNREEEIERHAKDLMDKTKAECEKMLTIARTEAQRLVDRHEVRSRAEEEARQIQVQVMEQLEMMRHEAISEIDSLRRESLEKARELEESAMRQSREIKVDADRYADDVLNHIEATLTQIQAISKNSRKYFVNHREEDLLNKATLN